MLKSIVCFAPVLLAAPGCMAAQTRLQYQELVRLAHAQPPAKDGDSDEEELARQPRLATLVRLALLRNPALREAAERTGAALVRVPLAARLPDLELKYEQWAVPLARPWDLSRADTLMLGLRQSFPAPGSLDARGRAALEEARQAFDAQQAAALEVVAQVRRSFADYYRADREIKVHLEHVELAMRAAELARANYQVGAGTQQDVLRTLVEQSRLHTDIAALEQEQRSSRAMLNALMARPQDAPLGPPAELAPAASEWNLAELEKLVEARRPELASAARAVAREEATLEASRIDARWPSFMAGADYMLMPLGHETTHGYGAMVSVNLPWLNPRHEEEVEEAEHALAAQRRALEGARNAALYQLRDAAARQRSAKESLAIVERDLLPQARQSFEAAQAAFAAGRGDALQLIDALRSFLQVKLERSRALARLEISLADLERVAGGEIASAELAPQTEPAHPDMGGAP